MKRPFDVADLHVRRPLQQDHHFPADGHPAQGWILANLRLLELDCDPLAAEELLHARCPVLLVNRVVQFGFHLLLATQRERDGELDRDFATTLLPTYRTKDEDQIVELKTREIFPQRTGNEFFARGHPDIFFDDLSSILNFQRFERDKFAVVDYKVPRFFT